MVRVIKPVIKGPNFHTHKRFRIIPRRWRELSVIFCLLQQKICCKLLCNLWHWKMNDTPNYYFEKHMQRKTLETADLFTNMRSSTIHALLPKPSPIGKQVQSAPLSFTTDKSVIVATSCHPLLTTVNSMACQWWAY